MSYIRELIEGKRFAEVPESGDFITSLDTSWKGDAKQRGECLAFSRHSARAEGEGGIVSIWRER
jgi:hypothetical protein